MLEQHFIAKFVTVRSSSRTGRTAGRYGGSVARWKQDGGI